MEDMPTRAKSSILNVVELFLFTGFLLALFLCSHGSSPPFFGCATRDTRYTRGKQFAMLSFATFSGALHCSVHAGSRHLHRASTSLSKCNALQRKHEMKNFHTSFFVLRPLWDHPRIVSPKFFLARRIAHSDIFNN